MRNRLTFIMFLCVLSTLLMGDLSWDNPLDISNYGNLIFQGEAARSIDGTTVAIYSALRSGNRRNYITAISPTNQQLWCIDLASMNVVGLCITSQSKIFLAYVGNSMLRSLWYNMDGSLHFDEPTGLIGNVYNTSPLPGVKLFPDSEGGVYVFATVFQPCRYQYVNAAGITSYNYSSTNLQSVTTSNGKVTNIEFLQDNSFVLTYDMGLSSGVAKVNTSMQLVFNHTYLDVTYCNFTGRADGSIYVGLRHASTGEIIAYNVQGIHQWSIPNLSINLNHDLSLYCNSADYLLVTRYSGSALVGQIYNSYGEIQLPQGGITISTSDTYYLTHSFYASGASGFFFIRNSPNTSGPYHLDVNHIGNQGEMWTQAQDLINTNYHIRVDDRCAIYSNGNLHVYNMFNTDTSIGITYNKYSSSGTAEYSSTGYPIVSEPVGNVRSIQMLPIGQDRAIVIGARGGFYHETQRLLQYNIVTHNGTLLFDEPQTVMPSLINHTEYRSIATDDGKVILFWRIAGETSLLRAQLIDENGNMLWDRNGKPMVSSLYGDEAISYYDGSLYIAYKESTYIKMQRYIDGEPVWGIEGVVAASVNTNWPGDWFGTTYLVNRTLFWVQEYTWLYGAMSFMCELDENGVHCEGFDVFGTPIVQYSAPYTSTDLKRVTKTDDRYWLNVYYHGDGLEFTGAHYLEHISNYGVHLNQGPQLPLSQGFACYSNEGCLYIASLTWNGSLQIMKFNPSGHMAWQQTALSGSTYGVSMNKLTDDELIVTCSTGYGSMVALTYLTFSPSGVIYPAQDTQYAIVSPQTYSNRLCSTNVGCYILDYQNEGYHSAIRFKASGAESSISDTNTQSHSLFNISTAYPNPFLQDTKFKLELEKAGFANMEVYNLRGQKVMNRGLNNLQQGSHDLSWNGLDDRGNACSNGIYFIRISINGQSQILKVALIK